MYGKIGSSWRLTNEDIEIEVEIPANTTATITLPSTRLENVRESGALLDATAGIYKSYEKEGNVILKVGSGFYSFKYANEVGFKVTFTEESRLVDVLEYKATKHILDQYAPGITNPPGIFAIKMKTLRELADFPEANLSINTVNVLIEELNKIEWNLAPVQ